MWKRILQVIVVITYGIIPTGAFIGVLFYADNLPKSIGSVIMLLIYLGITIWFWRICWEINQIIINN